MFDRRWPNHCDVALGSQFLKIYQKEVCNNTNAESVMLLLQLQLNVNVFLTCNKRLLDRIVFHFLANEDKSTGIDHGYQVRFIIGVDV